MFLKSFFYAGVCMFIVAPAWVVIASEYTEAPLLISTDAEGKTSPALQVFMQKVWLQSPNVRGAQATLDAALARADGADRPLHNPALGFETQRTDINTSIIGLSQTIDWSDKRGALVSIASRELQAAQAGLQQARQAIAVETLNALAGYFTTNETQFLVQRRSQLMHDFLNAVQQRRAAGDLAALDVTLAQVAHSEALMVAATSASELAEAKATLRAVSGMTASEWPQLPRELAPPPEQVAPTLLDTLPALAVLQSNVEAARAQVNLAKLQGKIDPTIGVWAGQEDSEGVLGLSIELPLFVRNNYRAETRAAKHEATAQEQVYSDAHRRARAQFDGALARFANTSNAWSVWSTTGQEALQEQMSLLEQMWQAGELTAIDYLVQAKQNIDARATATELMGETWRAAIAWLEASGQVEKWIFGENDVTKLKNSGETK